MTNLIFKPLLTATLIDNSNRNVEITIEFNNDLYYLYIVNIVKDGELYKKEMFDKLFDAEQSLEEHFPHTKIELRKVK